MNDEATKAPNGESGRTEAKIKYVNEKLIDKFLEKHNIDLDAIIAEFTDKEIVKDEGTDGTGSSDNGTTSTAGSHTKVVSTGVFKLNYLIRNGYLEIVAKDQTPKIKKQRLSKGKDIKEDDEIQERQETEK